MMVFRYQALILFLVPLIIGFVIFCVHWLGDRKRRASARPLPDRKVTLRKIFVPAFISFGLALLFAIPFGAITLINIKLLFLNFYTDEDPCVTHPEIACGKHRSTAKEIMGNSYEYGAIEMGLRYLLPGADAKSECYTNLATCQELTQIHIDLKDLAEGINSWILLNFGIWSVSGYFVGQIMIYISERIKKRSGKTNFRQTTL